MSRTEDNLVQQATSSYLGQQFGWGLASAPSDGQIWLHSLPSQKNEKLTP